jgi:hypothetical protein
LNPENYAMLRSLLASISFCGLSLLAPASRAEGVLLFDSGDAAQVALTSEATPVADGVRPEAPLLPPVERGRESLASNVEPSSKGFFRQRLPTPLVPPVIEIPTTATRTYRTPDLDEAAPRIQPQRRAIAWL